MSALVLPTKILPTGILPENWYCTFDKKNQKYYYFNTLTKERTWNLRNVIIISIKRKSKDNPNLNTKNIMSPPSKYLKYECIQIETNKGYMMYYTLKN